MTRGARLTITLAAGIALVASPACSGGEGPLTKQDFVARADEICKAANEKIGRLEQPDLTKPEATTRTIRRLLSIQRDELDELRRLQPPETDEPAIEEWLTQVAKALDEGENALKALQRSDREGVNDANSRGGEAQLQADDLARGYGIDACASAQDEPPTTTGTS